MKRRHFLALLPAILASCQRRVATAPVPLNAALLSAQQQDRDTLLRLFQQYKVSPQAILSTASPPVSVPEAVPVLKALRKSTMRLHPRFSEPAKATESKIGGLFLWSQGEPWPTANGVTLAPILQLHADLAPSQFNYRPATNLLQIFWNPTATAVSELQPVAFWRHTKEVTNPRDEPPNVVGYANMIPNSCRLFPESLEEYPPLSLLPERILDQVQGVANYDDLLATCPGSKVGGYPFGLKKETVTACPTCKRPMDFLACLAGHDWSETSRSRWMPKQEQANPIAEQGQAAWQRATGLVFTDLAATNRVNLFVCRRCENWPVQIIA